MDSSLLPLLYLAGPTLPIGGFAYSQGLASAIDLGWVKDRDSLTEWLRGTLTHGLGRLDLPVLLRMHEAVTNRDGAELIRLNRFLQAGRETAELLLEERQLGTALHRLLKTQNLIPDMELPETPGYLAMFAVAAVSLSITGPAACTGLAWSWLENQAAVACKTIPLGQTEAQSVLLAMLPRIEKTVHAAETIEDHELGGALPGLAMASSMHETQYSRMFRS